MKESTSNSGAAYLTLGVLLLAYILSFVDRNVMAVLIGPIREDFAISDFQYSLLHGFAFSMFYIVLGLPIARLADSRSRTLIITLGVLFWSAMTCVCGLAHSFAGLFVMRAGVGIGEAALSPPAYSLLSDYFPPPPCRVRWRCTPWELPSVADSPTSLAAPPTSTSRPSTRCTFRVWVG